MGVLARDARVSGRCFAHNCTGTDDIRVLMRARRTSWRPRARTTRPCCATAALPRAPTLSFRRSPLRGPMPDRTPRAAQRPAPPPPTLSPPTPPAASRRRPPPASWPPCRNPRGAPRAPTRRARRAGPRARRAGTGARGSGVRARGAARPRASRATWASAGAARGSAGSLSCGTARPTSCWVRGRHLRSADLMTVTAAVQCIIGRLMPAGCVMVCHVPWRPCSIPRLHIF